MRVTVFNGSPRKQGNTFELTKAILEELVERGAESEEVLLFIKNILGCNNCGMCQKGDVRSYCSIPDDMTYLYPKFLESDIVIFATPIYMWNFTPCTIAFLNRLHCLCRDAGSYNLMANKKVALALTMGAEEEVASFAIGGFKEFAEYFELVYKGAISIPYAEKENIAAGQYDRNIKAFVDSLLI
jgi:multimeric flavodoxin WrbA